MYRAVISADEVREYLSGAAIVAFDLETAPDERHRNERKAALDPHKARIVGISFSISEGSGIYVPLAHMVGGIVDDAIALWEWLKSDFFENPDIVKVAHNLSFEAAFLYDLGIIIKSPVYDTIAAAQLTAKSKTAFRELKDSGLKTLVPGLLKVDLPTFESVTKGRHFDQLDPADVETVRYACADSDYTLRLYHLFNSWFGKYLPRHRYVVEHIESPTAIYVGLMHYNGICVDKPAMYKKQFEADLKIADIRKEIQFLIGRDINIGANASTKSFKDYLYEDLKLPVLKRTEKEKNAADEEAIILLKDWCRDNAPQHLPLLEAVLEYRKWNKIKSTYVDGFIELINSATGRIHTSFFPLGTDTGRFSSSKPNLQNMPRKDNDPVGIRNFFMPSEGCLFLDFDFSQIELRVGAWYCRDEKMLDVYRTGGDIHAQTTAVLYGITQEAAADKNAPHFKERRSIAKNCNFGIFYGLYANGLMRNLKNKAGIEKTKAECEDIIQNLKDGYPGLVTWQKKTINQASNVGYTVTAFGRMRLIKGIHSTDRNVRSYFERCALNTPIQGTAADILKLAMARILDGLSERPWLRPIITIHDELLFEVPVGKADEAAVFIKSCMEKQPFDSFDVPIIAEGAKGYKFGELEEF